MNLKTIFRRSWLPVRLRTRKPTETIDITTVEETPKYATVRTVEEEQEIFRKRNKSRLSPQHRNILFDRKPYDRSYEKYHDSLLYKRKMLGRYGIEAAGVPAGIAWPTVDELEDMKEREKCAYPKSIQEIWKEIEKKNAEEIANAIARDKEVAAKMAKVETWIQEVLQKKAEKEQKLREAKLQKDKMMETIRREFGFTMSLNDSRLQELMEKKEMELRKQKKQAKKQMQQEMIVQKALEAAQALQTHPATPEKEPKK